MKALKTIFAYLLIISFLSCGKPFERQKLSKNDLETIENIQTEIKENPNDDTNFQILGVFYLKKNYINKAILNLEKCIKINPENHEARAWLGSAFAKKGREADGFLSLGKKKIYYVKKGYDYINKAKINAPNNPVIRIIRIQVICAIKNRFSFGKIKEVIDDLKFLKKISIEDETFPLELKGQFYLAYAIYYNTLSEMGLKADIDQGIYYSKMAFAILPSKIDKEKALKLNQSFINLKEKKQ